MPRLVIMLSLALSACMGAPDRPSDAGVDSATGSAARASLDRIEASPKDYRLQLGVLVMSLVVALAPLRPRRRRP